MRRVAGRVVATLGLAAVTSVGTAGAPAVGSPDTPAQAATAVELVSPPTLVHVGEPFQVDVRVTGAPAGATVDMVVYDTVETRRRFQRTLAGELTDERFRIPEQPVAGDTMTLGFTPGEDGRRLGGRGVYPVEVRVRSGGETVDSVITYLTFLNAATPEFVPLDVAVLVDVAATPGLQPDGTTVLPDDTLARTAQRIRVLDDAGGVPLTLAPRPETIEALAGGSLPAVGAVEQLRTLAQTHPVFARPFVDVDLVALERAGLLSEANAQADGGANVVRTRLGVEPTGGMWMSGSNFGTQAAEVITDLGINQVVVPPSAIEGGATGDESAGDGGSGSDGTSEESTGADPSVDADAETTAVPLAPVALGDGGPAAMVTDPLLAGHLVDSAEDGMVTAHRFVAELASLWMEAPANRRGIVVHLPPDVDIDPDVVAAALATLGDGQAARAVPVDQIFAEVSPLEDGPTAVQLAPYEPTDDLSPIAPALREARGGVDGVGALLGDPDLTTTLEQSLLVSTGRETPNESRAAYVARADTILGLVSDDVHLPDEFRITLTSRSADIPVQITNDSDQALQVLVTYESDQLEFPGGTSDIVDLGASTTTRWKVPVRSRTSGAFSLDITVTSPDGSIVLDETRFDVRSTAISGVGLVLSVGAGLFLAVWWARHWRSARRSRRLMPAGTVPESPGSDPAPTAPTDGPNGRGDSREDRHQVPSASAGTAPGRPEPPSPPARHGRAGPGTEGPDEPYRPAHMARSRSRSS